MAAIKDFLNLPAWVNAILAVIIFTIFEAALKKYFLFYMSIDIYIWTRTLIVLLFFFALLSFRKLEGVSPYISTYEPHKIHYKQWLRAFCNTSVTVILSFALTITPALSMVYAVFLLHPLVTIVLTHYWNDERPDYIYPFKYRVLPIVFTLVFAILFLFASEIALYVFGYTSDKTKPPQSLCHLVTESQDLDKFWGPLASFVGGVLFAVGNVLSSSCDKLYPQSIQRNRTKSSVTTTFLTNYLSFYILIAATLLIFLYCYTSGDDLSNLNLLCNHVLSSNIYIYMPSYIFSCLISIFALVCITKAFQNPGDQATSATMDVIALPLSIFTGLATQEFTLGDFTQPDRSIQLVAMLAIFIGARWSIQKNKVRSPHC